MSYSIDDVSNNTDLMNFQASISVPNTGIMVETCTEAFASKCLVLFLELEGQSPGSYNQWAKERLCTMFTLAWGINNSDDSGWATVQANCLSAFDVRYPDS
ncbi:hypothetical protein OAV62_01340 [bacterium]|nr:hypothetical protein [bacterium]